MLNELRNKPESLRRKAALLSSLTISLAIFGFWAYGKGYFGYSAPIVAEKTAEVETPEKSNTAPAPLTGSKSIISSLIDEMGQSYNQLRDTVAAVMVPFITNIEVYNKGDSSQ